MKTYPEVLAVPGPNTTTLEWIRRVGALRVAELGVYKGYTSIEIARLLGPAGTLDLFDFADVVEDVAQRARATGCVVHTHGNSYQMRDSYTWSLKKLLEQHEEPIWDYVFIDGAHTWDVDGFAFLLCDMLLKPGGYMDLDDYHWTLAGSEAMKSFPAVLQAYTEEQMQAKQVASVIELLVKRRGYSVVIPEKIYKKP